MRSAVAPLLVVAALVAGCEPSAPPSSHGEAQTGVVVSAAEREVTDLLRREQHDKLRRLSARAGVFQDAIDGLLTDPRDERLATAREAWGQLYGSFNEAVVVLVCRAAEDPHFAQLLQRVDGFPILPGYIDGLEQWPDSGIVHDISLPLTRESLLAQQGITAQEETSLGFQVVAFLLYGEPEHPRQPVDFTRITEVAEDEPLTVEEQPANRRRSYLSLATTVLVEDLQALTADAERLPVIGYHCPVDALRRTAERMIRASGLDDHGDVEGEYFSAHSRALALSGLAHAMMPWLSESSALRRWLGEAEQGMVLPVIGDVPDILALQQLHAALSAGRRRSR
ncbi:MAG: imelysin family protein [Alcanivoracaceae bacterium]